jgi:hypothetical protein
MHPLSRRATRTFILRIWSEYLDQTPPSWRGEIENVKTKEVTRFSSREELMVCVLRCFRNVSGPVDCRSTTEEPENGGCDLDL